MREQQEEDRMHVERERERRIKEEEKRVSAFKETLAALEKKGQAYISSDTLEKNE